MDPQHRILLELAHAALEHAGCDPERYPGRVGVFTGSALNTYFMNPVLAGRFTDEYIPTLIGNDKDFLSTRVSYKLNLRGPSITVQTACSTSMVAVHLACQSLLSEETDMALAGAVSVRVPHRAGYFCDGGGVTSKEKFCPPLMAAALAVSRCAAASTSAPGRRATVATWNLKAWCAPPKSRSNPAGVSHAPSS